MRAARRGREGGGRAGGPGGRQPQATRTRRASVLAVLGFDDFPLLVGNSHEVSVNEQAVQTALGYLSWVILNADKVLMVF